MLQLVVLLAGFAFFLSLDTYGKGAIVVIFIGFFLFRLCALLILRLKAPQSTGGEIRG